MAIKGNCVRHGDFETDHGHCPDCMAMPRFPSLEIHPATGRETPAVTFRHGEGNIKSYIAMKANDIVNGARRSAYGTPENNFARIAVLWAAWFEARGITMRNAEGEVVRLSARDVSPLMRLMKEARLCESPDHLDSFVDLVGYTLTGAEVEGVDVPEAGQ